MMKDGNTNHLRPTQGVIEAVADPGLSTLIENAMTQRSQESLN